MVQDALRTHPRQIAPTGSMELIQIHEYLRTERQRKGLNMTRILALALSLAATPLFAADITVEDAYARASRPGAPTGAMFMTIRNSGDADDRLVAVESPIAQLVELHTHIDDNGVMKMRPVDDGFEIPAGGEHQLMRGGDHVMLMGLTQSLENGKTVPLTLVFEKAGEITLDVTVDNDRQQGMGMGNGNRMGQGN